MTPLHILWPLQQQNSVEMMIGDVRTASPTKLIGREGKSFGIATTRERDFVIEPSILQI